MTCLFLIGLQDSDFGPVPRCILAQDENELSRLVSLPCDLEEPSSFGWTPLLLSVFWPLGMEILLKEGVQIDKVSRIGNANAQAWSVTPLSLAIETRKDEAIVLLLDARCAIFYPCRFDPSSSFPVLESLRRLGYLATSPIVAAVIRAMADRRQRLRKIALELLPLSELEHLQISRDGETFQVLDDYALATASALRKAGVTLPKALEPPQRQGSVYHENINDLSPDVANQLWSVGFRCTHTYDEQGLTPLHRACWKGEKEIARWFLDHGGDPLKTVRGCFTNALHLLIIGSMSTLGGHRHDVFARLVGILGSSCRDDCRCACAIHGCTPTTLLFRKTNVLWQTYTDWHTKCRRFEHWSQVLCQASAAVKICCYEFARLETFERLGITHVCCRHNRDPEAGELIVMPQDTQEEIQDEESEMIEELDLWMMRYEKERAAYKGSAMAFLGEWSALLRCKLGAPSYWHGSEDDYFAETIWNDHHLREDLFDTQYCIPGFNFNLNYQHRH